MCSRKNYFGFILESYYEYYDGHRIINSKILIWIQHWRKYDRNAWEKQLCPKHYPENRVINNVIYNTDKLITDKKHYKWQCKLKLILYIRLLNFDVRLLIGTRDSSLIKEKQNDN